jgi:hypothetical protein
MLGTAVVTDWYPQAAVNVLGEVGQFAQHPLRGTQKSRGSAHLCRRLTTGRRSCGHPLGGRQPWSLTTDIGRGMIDGREDREERKKRRGREQRENRKDRIDRDYVDEWEQERVQSLWLE